MAAEEGGDGEMKLTAKRVEKLRKVPGRHSDGSGLYLEVVSATTTRHGCCATSGTAVSA